MFLFGFFGFGGFYLFIFFFCCSLQRSEEKCLSPGAICFNNCCAAKLPLVAVTRGQLIKVKAALHVLRVLELALGRDPVSCLDLYFALKQGLGAEGCPEPGQFGDQVDRGVQGRWSGTLS